MHGIQYIYNSLLYSSYYSRFKYSKFLSSRWLRIFGLVVRKQLNSDTGNVCYLFAEVPAPIAAAGAVTTLDVSLFARFIQRYLLVQTNWVI